MGRDTDSTLNGSKAVAVVDDVAMETKSRSTVKPGWQLWLVVNERVKV